MPAPPRPFRLLLLPGVLALVAGLLGGLYRLGWPVMPLPLLDSAAWHGALMTSAFFGTLIGMERAAAMGRRWPFLAPLFSGSGGVILLASGPPAAAAGLMTLAAAILLIGGLVTLKRHAVTAPALVSALGASCWLAGNLTWLLTGGSPMLTPAWLAFIVLTIAGERLELTRFVATSESAKRHFALIVGTLPLALALGVLDATAGLTLYSAGLLGLAIWLLCHDIARRNLDAQEPARFIAFCLMGGYIFLAAGGLLGLAGGLMPGHRWYDAALHAVALGFIFSMVLGHVLIVLPAIARIHVPFERFLYLPLAALHLSLYLRIAGSMAGHDSVVRYGALANVLSLLLFAVALAVCVWRGARGRTR